VLVIVVWASTALVIPVLPLAPNEVNLPRILGGPELFSGSALHGLFGYDELGRPLFDRIVYGARTSFVVALAVVSTSVLIGTFVGMLSAWAGGKWDHATMRVVDIFLAFPGILLAIALAGVLGPGLDNVVIALCAAGWVGFARLARAQSLSIKHREHVMASRALGLGDTRILLRHILPYILAPLIVEASFAVAGVVIAEAGLSYLGLGVQPPGASWGTILREGTRYMLVAPHMVVGPSVVLLTVVLAINLLGDQLRDHLDVRLRRREGSL
jgi:peptide/nickel transport system permease protein